MLKAVAFANAFTVVAEGIYVLCRILSLVAPGMLFRIGQSWFHTFSLDAMRMSTAFSVGTFLIGGITIGLLTWVTMYAGVSLYNRWAK